MSYIEKHVHGGEHVIKMGRFHWLWHARAWAALILLGWLIIGIIIFIREMIRLHTTEFAITNRSIIKKTGFLSAHVHQLSLEAIESAKLDQGILGRMFGYGRLDIDGRGEGKVDFPTMANPQDFLSALNEAQIEAEDQPMKRLADEIEHHDHAA